MIRAGKVNMQVELDAKMGEFKEGQRQAYDFDFSPKFNYIMSKEHSTPMPRSALEGDLVTRRHPFDCCMLPPRTGPSWDVTWSRYSAFIPE